jgi:indole-3-glycerol phosphate synthase
MTNTPDILKKIIARKTEEIAQNKIHTSLAALTEKAQSADKPRGFYQALRTQTNQQQPAIIAEIKKASPSKGVLRQDFNPAEIAKSYAQAGASCLSVLTDKDFFQGDDQFLVQARKVCQLPVLRKEFIINAYQVYEARALDADCILLIAACLDDCALMSLSELAISMNMDVLIEVHNLEELKRVLKLKLPMVGVNNRNLRTFEVSLQTTLDLLAYIDKDTLVITESGILTSQDVELMREHKVYGYLVGEAFMRASNPGQALQEIFK